MAPVRPRRRGLRAAAGSLPMLFALLFALLPARPAQAAAVNSAAAAFSSHVAETRPPAIDGDIYWDGLGHDSRDTLYRVPGGAVTANRRVTLRFRTYHEDATGVTLRTYHTGLGAEQLYEMRRASTGVD